jgi:lactoylglutathione lyase
MKTKYLHTMVRVKDLDVSIAFYELLGLKKFAIMTVSKEDLV